MKQQQINKKEPYYVTGNNLETMPPEQTLQKARNEKFLKALQTLAERDPEGFSNVAPELIKRSVWNWRGADPFFAERLSNWIDTAHKWSDFKEILPKEAHLPRKKTFEAFSFENLPKQYGGFLEHLSQRFEGDYTRWDASKRDQFTILGMLALEGKEGVRQGRLIHHLGLDSTGSVGLPGSNAIRAVKIALSRSAKPLQLWVPATGNGSERLHAFDDSNLADLVARFVLNQQAAILLPPVYTLEG